MYIALYHTQDSGITTDKVVPACALHTQNSSITTDKVVPLCAFHFTTRTPASLMTRLLLSVLYTPMTSFTTCSVVLLYTLHHWDPSIISDKDFF